MFGRKESNTYTAAFGLEKAMTTTSRMRYKRRSLFDWAVILRILVIVGGLAFLAVGCWGVIR